MCRAVTCKQCGKTTWAGCGMHVDQVLANVPKDKRCTGHSSKSAGTPASWKPSAKTGQAADSSASQASTSKGFLARLRGR